MKRLVKRILEAGLVDKHLTRMFERWGQLEQGSEQLVGQKVISQQTLNEFVEELEVLLEADPETKETRLEIVITKPPVELYSPTIGVFSAVEDVMGKYIVSPNVVLYQGCHVWPNGSPSTEAPWTVFEVEPLHQGDNLVAYQVTVEKPE